MIKKLINTGIHDGLTFKEQSKIRIFITSSLIVACISIVFALLRFLKGDYFASVVSILQFAYYGFFSIFLIHKRKYLLSYHLSISAGMLFIFFVSMMYGERMQTHIFFFFMPMAAVILFDNLKVVFIHSCLAISLLIISKISFEYQTPFYPYNSMDENFGTMNLFFIAIIIFWGG